MHLSKFIRVVAEMTRLFFYAHAYFTCDARNCTYAAREREAARSGRPGQDIQGHQLVVSVLVAERAWEGQV
ncbi:hypothetical protein E2C01_080949 [Portunus trituberculatus]|uniref:Uncharacterized protein n=1 Tax=Portunus trituberculatus TaxID=210409 RepID=A0A5B7IUY9_PORTR|nr:hypothetical protein [Portunus trituberculatus]